METKTCKVCGRELPETDFHITCGGGRVGTCKECVKAALRKTLAQKRPNRGGNNRQPIPDADFDGKTIGDVWRLMCRAEKWLESRGCVISLNGEFREVKVRKLKKI